MQVLSESKTKHPLHFLKILRHAKVAKIKKTMTTGKDLAVFVERWSIESHVTKVVNLQADCNGFWFADSKILIL